MRLRIIGLLAAIFIGSASNGLERSAWQLGAGVSLMSTYFAHDDLPTTNAVSVAPSLTLAYALSRTQQALAGVSVLTNNHSNDTERFAETVWHNLCYLGYQHQFSLARRVDALTSLYLTTSYKNFAERYFITEDGYLSHYVEDETEVINAGFGFSVILSYGPVVSNRLRLGVKTDYFSNWGFDERGVGLGGVVAF